jgi:pyruvate,orthophosphate dikinase
LLYSVTPPDHWTFLRVISVTQIGVCGEHGGDPESIAFFNTNDIDYVSCSPYRIPVAKVAAAQAHIERSASK